jgi:hypothetical protein
MVPPLLRIPALEVGLPNVRLVRGEAGPDKVSEEVLSVVRVLATGEIELRVTAAPPVIETS